MISIHALREEGDLLPTVPRFPSWAISIHALREEGDLARVARCSTLSNFYPRPPRGGRRADQDHQSGRRSISIHALREEGDRVVAGACLGLDISIHALREEGDFSFADGAHLLHGISIHALREEGDSSTKEVSSMAAKFLSTPSARRATGTASSRVTSPSNFYPRPPRGGRQAPAWRFACSEYFYPRPPRGGRPVLCGAAPCSSRFLSTPSARRATAKTETKSLFSYKLYNILHEFRRALIYNGSKNYPNHAK